MEIEFPIEFLVSGTPVSAQTESVTSREKWKTRVRAASRKAIPNPHLTSDGRIAVTLFYFPAGPMQGDIDNIVKFVLDALSKHIYLDDHQVERIVVQKFEPGNIFSFSQPSKAFTKALSGPKPLLWHILHRGPSRIAEEACPNIKIRGTVDLESAREKTGRRQEHLAIQFELRGAELDLLDERQKELKSCHAVGGGRDSKLQKLVGSKNSALRDFQRLIRSAVPHVRVAPKALVYFVHATAEAGMPPVLGRTGFATTKIADLQIGHAIVVRCLANLLCSEAGAPDT